MKQRIGVLDSFRGLAAIVVLYYHYTYWFRHLYGHSFSSALDFPYGSYAVYFFFIISGFVIFLTVERCKTPIEFVYRRLVRLYPTYWLCLIASSVFLYYFGIAEVRPGFIQFIVNTTMVQRLLKYKDIDPCYWSLLPELVFYFIIFCVFSLKQLNRIYLWGSIWVICSFFNVYLGLFRVELLLQYAGLFFSGILFYKMFQGDKRWIHHVSILFCYITIVLNIGPVGINNVSNYLLIGIIYLLFYLFLYNKLNFLDNRLLRFLGYISYPLYLVHQEMGFTILLHLRSYGFTGYWVIFIPMAFSIALAFVIAKYFEKPIIKLAKHNIEKRFFLREKEMLPNT